MPRRIERCRRMRVRNQASHLGFVVLTVVQRCTERHLLFADIRYPDLRPAPIVPSSLHGTATATTSSLWTCPKHSRFTQSKFEAPQNNCLRRFCAENGGDRHTVAWAITCPATLDCETYAVLECGSGFGLRVYGPCRVELVFVDDDRCCLGDYCGLAATEEAPIKNKRTCA